MGVFDETDAKILSAAFEAALSNYGVAKSGDITKQQKVDTSVVDKTSVDRNTSTNLSTPSSPNNKTKKQMEAEIDLITTALSLPAKAVKTYDGAVDALSKNARPVLEQYNEIQLAYGGLNVDLDKAVGSSRAVIDRLQAIQNAYYNVDEAGTQMSKNLGQSGNIASKYFKDEAAMFNKSEEVLGMLVDQHSQYINKLDEETLIKLPFYAESMGISSRDVAESVERQINLTGTANTTMLDDIMKFSAGLEKTTGIPLKAISANAVQIANDTQRLGDVTAEEATRISATLGQLGQTYDSFTGALDKFQEFGSAAETSGLISQITGGAVNLDAQQLMYLASEEQEKFLPELRRSLLGGGFTKETFEALSTSEQKQFAATLSMDREKVKALLDTSREFNEADLIDTQAKISEDGTEGFDAIMANMELAPKAFETSSDAMIHHRTAAVVPLQQKLLLAAEAQEKLNAALRDNVKLTDAEPVTKSFDAVLDKQIEGTAAVTDKIQPGTEIGVVELGEALSDGFDSFNKQSQKVEPTPNQSPPANTNTANTTNPKVKLPKPSETQVAKPAAKTPAPEKAPAEQVSTSAIENAQIKNAELAQSNATLGEKLDTLVSTLEGYFSNTSKDKEIVLNIDGNALGKVVIDQEYIVNGATTKIVTTP